MIKHSFRPQSVVMGALTELGFGVEFREDREPADSLCVSRQFESGEEFSQFVSRYECETDPIAAVADVVRRWAIAGLAGVAVRGRR